MSALISDIGYDANYIVEEAQCVEVEAVVPLDRKIKLQDIMIKSCLKHFRRVATRYDKLDIAYLVLAFLARIYLWLK